MSSDVAQPSIDTTMNKLHHASTELKLFHAPEVQPPTMSNEIPVDLTDELDDKLMQDQDKKYTTSPPGRSRSSIQTPGPTEVGSEHKLIKEDDVDVNANKFSHPGQSSTIHKRTHEVPSFDQLRQRSLIILKDAAPGNLQFPGHLAPNGTYSPFTALIVGNQQRILAPPNEPLWKQMHLYCQRWGAWVAMVEDEKRRRELMDWVTLRMKEAWEIGIRHGHCGDPTGHSTCCSAHGPQNDSSGDCTNSPQRKNTKEVRKRPMDLSRQPVAFACEGNKLNHSIINRELEKAGVSMEAIMQQIILGLEVGEDLLADITQRLGGRPIQSTDWTASRFFQKFDPRFNNRNLFMYCLWEVQRCRNMVNSFIVALNRPSATSQQQKVLQKRIETNRDRAEQHLALAIVLDDRASADDEEGEGEEEEDAEHESVSDRQVRRSKRPTKAASVIEIASDDNDTDLDMAESTTSRSASPESLLNDIEHDFNGMNKEAEQVERASPSPSTSEVQLSEDPMDTSSATADGRVSEEPARKRCKLDSEAAYKVNSLDEVQDSKSQSYHEQFLQTQMAEDSLEMSSEPSQHSKHFDPTKTDWHDPPRNTDNSAVKQKGIALEEMHLMRMYILHVWQPRINAILDINGFEPLDANLGGWPDIEVTLQDIGYDELVRNQLMREFRHGYEVWKNTMIQQQSNHRGAPQHQLPQQPAIVPPPITKPTQTNNSTSMEHLETTSKGLSVRYFTNTTKSERDRIDNSIMEYHDHILEERINRFGFYVVFVDPHNPLKQIAHGFWTLMKNKHPDDAAWFYEDNAPKPATFREHEQIFPHEWGFSVPAPKPQPNRSKRAPPRSADQNESRSAGKQTRLDRRAPVGSSSGNGSGSSKSSKITKPKQSVHNNNARKRRRVIMDADDDDDDEYHPGDF